MLKRAPDNCVINCVFSFSIQLNRFELGQTKNQIRLEIRKVFLKWWNGTHDMHQININKTILNFFVLFVSVAFFFCVLAVSINTVKHPCSHVVSVSQKSDNSEARYKILYDSVHKKGESITLQWLLVIISSQKKFCNGHRPAT